MQVTTTDLRSLATTLLAHLEESGHPVVDLDVDYYWDVPPAARYNPYEKPDELTIGQLSDNWSELQRILTDKKLAVNYALVWLAALLRRVGEIANEVPPAPPT